MFDQTYFDTIWPTQGVHRHDYCPDLAQRLVNQYGPVRFLDIGTGCGFLVQCLRDLSADAWGLEVSDYALANSCIPAYVRKGDIRNIPFAANSFDVVHSQGVWGYFPKEDIHKAWTECQRVGKIQVHSIDYNDTVPAHHYVVSESADWWRNQFYPKVLVACPNHECKEYAFGAWLAAVRKLDYPNYEVLVVDNSPTVAFCERWQDRVPLLHRPVNAEANQRIAQSMEYIRQYFLAGDATWWFNLESDVIAPSHVIKELLAYNQDSDWICHNYPDRTNPLNVMSGFGCSLFSRKIMANSFTDLPLDTTADAWWWHTKIKNKPYRVVELWGSLALDHLDNPHATA